MFPLFLHPADYTNKDTEDYWTVWTVRKWDSIAMSSGHDGLLDTKPVSRGRWSWFQFIVVTIEEEEQRIWGGWVEGGHSDFIIWYCIVMSFRVKRPYQHSEIRTPVINHPGSSGIVNELWNIVWCLRNYRKHLYLSNFFFVLMGYILQINHEEKVFKQKNGS